MIERDILKVTTIEDGTGIGTKISIATASFEEMVSFVTAIETINREVLPKLKERVGSHTPDVQINDFSEQEELDESVAEIKDAIKKMDREKYIEVLDAIKKVLKR